MSLVLALEPDPKQAAILKQVVRDRVGAEFVLADSKDGAIAAIAERVPDVILVTALLSPRDEKELTDHLRHLDGAEHLQTLTIPLLASGAVEPAKKKKRGLLSALTGDSSKPAAPIGCDPKVFAEEIRNYLLKAEDAKAKAAAERSRSAKKSAGAGRKKSAPATVPASRSTKSGVESSRIPKPAQKPPVVEEKTEATSGSYWAWDSPTPAEAAAAERPVKTPAAPTAPGGATPDRPHAPDASDAPAAPVAPDVPVFSSWSNPWDVSKSPTLVQPRHEEAVSAEPGRDPLVYLGDHQLPADALVPSAQEEAVEQLLGQPATLSPAEMIEAAPVAPVAPVAPDDEIDLSSLLSGAPTLSLEGEAESDALSDVFTISKDFDLSALLAQALDTPATRSGSGGRQQSDEADAARAADAQALLDLKADVDRLRADREEVERALAEARAAQERAEHAAHEVSSKAQEDLERHTRVAERAKEEVAAERRSREQTERELREEAERRLEVERLARAEAERLAREVEARMREEAEAERRLRAEAERHVAEAHAARAREVAERTEQEQAQRLAREQAEQQAGAERRAREQAEARADAERQAREAAEQKIAEEAARYARESDERMSRERLAREQAEARADAERRAREETEQKIRDEAARLAQEAEQKYKGEAARLAKEVEQRAAAERQAREQAEARAETERQAREAAEKKGKEESERLAMEAAEQRRAHQAERKSRELAERRAALEAEAREAAEQRAREDFERREREIAEKVAREAAERKAQQEAERVARERADKAAREEAERRVAEERKARQEAERLARREAERRADAERRAKEEAERLAAEAAVKAREEARAERKARELAERRASEERRARELAERKAREEAARRAAAELRAKKEAEERDRDRARRATGKKPVIIKKAGKKRAEPARVAAKSKAKEPRPTQDEWGLYDPDKCGMGALFAKLEEIEEGAEVDERSAADDLNDDDADYRAPVVERNPRPLSMWAWRTASDASAPNGAAADKPAAPVAPDDFRALVDRLTIPAAVAAVRYASGARIGRVKITRRRRRARTASGEARVIILSRKLLAAVRQESAPTGRLTTRR